MQGAAGALGNRSVRLVLTASAPSAAAGATSGAVEHLRVGSSTAWLQRQGPVVVDGVYAGEVYDARLEVPGWNEAFASTAPARPAGWMPACQPHGLMDIFHNIVQSHQYYIFSHQCHLELSIW